jgi:hypothetical protein
MRRTLAIFVGVIYGILTVGVHLHLHYCCGKLSEIHISSVPDDCCDQPNKHACGYHTNCCETDLVDLVIEDEHFSSAFSLWFAPHKLEVPVFYTAMSTQENTSANAAHAPPIHRRRFLEHCSLLFYA